MEIELTEEQIGVIRELRHTKEHLGVSGELQVTREQPSEVLIQTDSFEEPTRSFISTDSVEFSDENSVISVMNYDLSKPMVPMASEVRSKMDNTEPYTLFSL